MKKTFERDAAIFIDDPSPSLPPITPLKRAVYLAITVSFGVLMAFPEARDVRQAYSARPFHLGLTLLFVLDLIAAAFLLAKILFNLVRERGIIRPLFLLPAVLGIGQWLAPACANNHEEMGHEVVPLLMGICFLALYFLALRGRGINAITRSMGGGST